MMKLPRKKFRAAENSAAERGVVAVEMVVVAPVLIMLLLGVVEFGRYYNASINVTSAAREAVRKVALYDSASAAAAATAAASPVTVSVGAMTTCPASGIGDASITLTSAFTFDAFLVGLGNKTITRTAVMRCGG